MESRDEWYVEFEVADQGRSARDGIERLVDEAIGWVEARSLGLGGGCGPARGDIGGSAESWIFRGGICNKREGMLIPAEQAMEFLDFLRSTCVEKGLHFQGKLEPFSTE
jgi:hypothetical protein